MKNATLFGAIDAEGVLWAVARSDTAALTKAYTATVKQLPRPQVRATRASLRMQPCASCVRIGPTPTGMADMLREEGWNVGRIQWDDRDGQVHANGCSCPRAAREQ